MKNPVQGVMRRTKDKLSVQVSALTPRRSSITGHVEDFFVTNLHDARAVSLPAKICCPAR